MPIGCQENSSCKRRGRRQVDMAPMSAEAPPLPVSKLIPEVLSFSQDRAGMSLAALKKALAATGYDVERNNNRIKLALKTLVSKGTLVQTKGTGACGSFRLNKKVSPDKTMSKAKKPTSAKPKKLGVSQDRKSPRSTQANKGVKKPKTTAKKAASETGRKAKGIQQRKSPAKVRAANPQTGRPKLTLEKTNPKKTTSKK
uniref:histone H1t-like n=1 Tax=Jaculus jaculus TaxID=51337 RepID=UPI001E1AFB41|nr:histone H1t-like [Jaculus jaculus]